MAELYWFLASVVLILFVLLLRAVLGKHMNAGLRYGLWLLVLLRLLIPGTVLHSRVSVAAVTDRAMETEVMQSVDNYLTQTKVYAGGVSGKTMTTEEAQQLHPGKQLMEESIYLQKDGSYIRHYAFRDTLKAQGARVLRQLWRCGMILTAAVFLGSNLRLCRRLRKQRRPLETYEGRRVYVVDELSSSCLFLGSIYVSAETAADETALAYVLAHETAHARHGDDFWALLRCAALVLHWFDPLVWYAAKLSQQDGELFADAGALKQLGEDAAERYGQILIRLSAGCPGSTAPLCTATTMCGGKKALRERITHIARRPRMRAWALSAVVLLGFGALSLAFVGAAADEKEPFTLFDVSVAMLDADGNETTARDATKKQSVDIWKYYDMYLRILEDVARDDQEPLAPEDLTEPLSMEVRFSDGSGKNVRSFRINSQDVVRCGPKGKLYRLDWQTSCYDAFYALYDQLGVHLSAAPGDLDRKPVSGTPETTDALDISLAPFDIDEVWDYDAVMRLYTRALTRRFSELGIEVPTASVGAGHSMVSFSRDPQRFVFDISMELAPIAGVALPDTLPELRERGGRRYYETEAVLTSSDGLRWTPESVAPGNVGWRGYRLLYVDPVYVEELIDEIAAAHQRGEISERCDQLLWCGEFIPWEQLTRDGKLNAVQQALREAAVDESYPTLGTINDDHLYRDLYMLYAASHTDGAFAELFAAFVAYGEAGEILRYTDDCLLGIQYRNDPEAFQYALNILPEQVFLRLAPFLQRQEAAPSPTPQPEATPEPAPAELSFAPYALPELRYSKERYEETREQRENNGFLVDADMEAGGVHVVSGAYAGTPHGTAASLTVFYPDAAVHLPLPPRNGSAQAADLARDLRLDLVNRTLTYTASFDETLLDVSGEYIIHQAGTYYYTYDLDARSVSLEIVP